MVRALYTLDYLTISIILPDMYCNYLHLSEELTENQRITQKPLLLKVKFSLDSLIPKPMCLLNTLLP